MITSYPAAHIAHELGISVLSEDVPKLVSAIHRAYATGQRDALSDVETAVAIEREACAQIAERFGPERPIVSRSPSQLIVGRWEGEQAASSNISAAIRARSNT